MLTSAAQISTLLGGLPLFTILELTVGLSGVLLRYRVHYEQKSDRFGVTTGLRNQLSGMLSFIGMGLKIRRIEGWSGLYKGLFARNLEICLAALAFNYSFGRHPAAPGFLLASFAPQFDLQQCAMYVFIVTAVAVPMRVFITRATVTPYRLSDASTVFRVLLSPTERQDLVLLYFIPGLVAAIGIHTILTLYAAITINHLMLPLLSYSRRKLTRLLSVIGYYALVSLSRAALTPFDVIATRLALQRRSDEKESLDDVELSGQSNGSVPLFAPTTESLVRLREDSGLEAYKGFIDCWNKIRNEEGDAALFRGWLGSIAQQFWL
ncbi:hypothetical protein Moror_12363 [Moniliophthora roreri MCA 2997]|uniref:Mitochondrial carrier n=2 Tax=Moniliophthora roreri TaxID=221103 RepID=V2XTK0_MONRO|nr:hypothetical protein Moror_12363 [Moniliophthora roreri MCA 2997]